MNMSLAENAPQCADWYFMLLWHDRGINYIAGTPHKFDMATLLTDFNEPHCFKTSPDLAKS